LYRLNPEKDATQIEQLKGQTLDGRLHEFAATVDGKEFVVYARRPSRAEYKRFRADINNEKKQAGAVEMLLSSCILHPNTAAFQAILEEAPGLSETFGEELLKVCGLAVSADSKKF
jgi:hypothetical protein